MVTLTQLINDNSCYCYDRTEDDLDTPRSQPFVRTILSLAEIIAQSYQLKDFDEPVYQNFNDGNPDFEMRGDWWFRQKIEDVVFEFEKTGLAPRINIDDWID